jgi:hypothetical protein
MEQEWYIHSSGEKSGPFSIAEVLDLISAGRVAQGAWIGCGDQWTDVDTFRVNHANQLPSPTPDPPLPYAVPAPSTPLASLAQASEDRFSTPASVFATAVTEPDWPPVIERDAILLLGRRRAGKTVYLATLYAMLWKAIGGVTMKALSGPTHKMLMAVNDQLKRQEWPEATLGTRQLEFELTHHGRRYLLVAFDYSGEDFRKAFIEEDTASTETKKLLNYVDRASAVILLLDPAVATGGKYDEVVDDDFGMVQAVQRVRDWQGGEEVPIVVVLTKADRNQNLIRSHGSAHEFVLRNYPALARTLKRAAVFNVSAIQETGDGDGRTVPSPDSVPINIEKPLLYCIKELTNREKQKGQEAAQAAKEEARRQQIELEEQELAKANRRLWTYVIGFIVLCLCGFAIMYMLLTSR